MRVLAVTNLWPSGRNPSCGAAVVSQMQSVEQQGVAVDVYFVNRRIKLWGYIVGAWRMLCLNFGPRRYSVVHAHTGHCGVLARLQWRYPVLVSYIGYDLHGEPRPDGTFRAKNRIEVVVFRWLSRLVEATVTMSTEMEAILPRAVRGRSTVLPNGVDRSSFRPLARDTARRQLGWPLDEVTVLFVGRASSPGKRVDLSAAACDIAARQVEGLRFRICAGQSPDVVPIWMNAADALILTSVAEGSPNVVKEALACNLPVVATDVGDVAELLEQARRCRVMAVDSSAEEIAAALVDVLRDAPARTCSRDETRHLDSDVIAGRLTSIYRNLAGESAGRADQSSETEEVVGA